MKILLIDDIPQALDTLVIEINEKQWECAIIGFNDYQQKINDWDPDVVVIDLKKDDSDHAGEGGNQVFNEIWSNRFRPIVIFSADPSLLNHMVHPLINDEKKGKGSERKVIQHLIEYSKYIEVIGSVEDELVKIIQTSLKNLFNYESTSHFDYNQFPHLLKRRIAASMDVPDHEDRALPAHYRYVYPPIGDSPKLGDIIQNEASKVYKIVLTPSCDMECGKNRRAKVGKILVAECKILDKNDYNKLGLIGTPEEDKMKLTHGFVDSLMPLPTFGSLLPHLVVHFKSLELININKSNGIIEGHKRITSLDSPFREQVSWAFIQNSGRPGIPDCNYLAWAEEMTNKVKN